MFPALPSLSTDTPANTRVESSNKSTLEVKTESTGISTTAASVTSAASSKTKKGKTPPPSPSGRTRRGPSTQTVDNDDNESIASLLEGRASRSGRQGGSVPPSPSCSATGGGGLALKRGRSDGDNNNAKRAKRGLTVITEEPEVRVGRSKGRLTPTSASGSTPASIPTAVAITGGRSTRGGGREKKVEEKAETRRGGRRK